MVEAVCQAASIGLFFPFSMGFFVLHVLFHFYGSVSFFIFVSFIMCHAFITVGNQLYFGVFLFLCTMRRWHAQYACKRNVTYLLTLSALLGDISCLSDVLSSDAFSELW